MKSTGVILSVEKIASYLKSNEIGVRLSTAKHNIVARIPNSLELKIGQKYKAKLVSIENSGDYAAISFKTE